MIIAKKSRIIAPRLHTTGLNIMPRNKFSAHQQSKYTNYTPKYSKRYKQNDHHQKQELKKYSKHNSQQEIPQFFMPQSFSVKPQTNFKGQSIVFILMTLLLMQQCQAMPNSIYNRNDLPVTHLSAKLENCQLKTHGVSLGKICEINGADYMLKSLYQPSELNVQPNMIQNYHNLNLLKSIGIQTPESFFICEPNGLVNFDDKMLVSKEYFASKFEDKFTTAQKINSKLKKAYKIANIRKQTELSEDSYHCHHFLEKIGGNQGLAQLAVSGTLIHDLTINGGNWGALNDKLMVIDADLSPSDISEYHLLAKGMPVHLKDYKLFFSIEVLKAMLDDYDQLIKLNQKNEFQGKIKIPKEAYHLVLSNFKEAVSETIEHFKFKYDASEHHIEINDYLSDKLFKTGEKNKLFKHNDTPELLFLDDQKNLNQHSLNCKF